MDKKDLIVGEIYKYNFNLIFKYLGENEDLKHPTLWIKNKAYNNITWGFGLNLELATQEEKEHLQQCIKAGKYVDCKPIKLILHYGLL